LSNVGTAVEHVERSDERFGRIGLAFTYVTVAWAESTGRS
jgi:hypothetical protein